MERDFSSCNIRAKNSKRCGTIIFNPDYTKIVVILNRFSYQMGENKWGLPKGGLKKGEQYISCAERETLEETGLRVKINKRSIVLQIAKTSYFPFVLDETCKDKFNPVDKHEIYKVEWAPITELQNFKKQHTNSELKRLLKKSILARAKRIASSNTATLL